MKDDCITTPLYRAIDQVDAIDTLGASLAVGLHAGVVTHEHVQTLITVMARQIRGHLEELRVAIDGLSL
ncbi:hypothetical protein FHW84_002566 [Dyella sp. SG562]|uniref:hypothetical protein n=1 Tax=Dyella sp. SG562 TaxID=2587017 RepID=UPI00141F4453|nr:hypothetical protein [Dyella sp. SG562]NII73981.1 hypothetical protein [Dyella sp. SG562]